MYRSVSSMNRVLSRVSAAYNKLKELTQKVWHTEKEIKTDANGIASFRGFYGKYDIEITVDGKIVTKEINLSKKLDNEFEVII